MRGERKRKRARERSMSVLSKLLSKGTLSSINMSHWNKVNKICFSFFFFFLKFCRTSRKDEQQRGKKLSGGNHLLLLVAVCLWLVAAEARKRDQKGRVKVNLINMHVCNSRNCWGEMERY